MLLRTAQTDDLPALYALWEEAFGDEKPVIDAFFTACFAPENTLAAFEHGRLLSALYLIPAVYRRGAQTFSAAYIFAAATRRAARGRGLMTALLRFAKETARKRGLDLLFLVPATPELFAFYRARGFSDGFQKTVYTVPGKALGTAAPIKPAQETAPAAYLAAREAALSGVPHIAWGEDALRLALRYDALFGSRTYVLQNGFFTAETDGETTTAAEFCAADDTALPVLCGALAAFGAETYTLCTPCKMPVPKRFGAGETVTTGLYLPISGRARTEKLPSDAYLGITFG